MRNNDVRLRQSSVLNTDVYKASPGLLLMTLRDRVSSLCIKWLYVRVSGRE